MAKDDKSPSLPRNIFNRLRSLQKQMNGLYTDTYSTYPDTRDQLRQIGSDAEDNISAILARNDNKNISNISKLYAIANLRASVNDKKLTDDIIEFFEDRQITDALMNSYTENKWIAELDREYDVVCKYMPMLTEALNTIKDATLTADNFDKEYLTFRSLNVGHTENSTFVEEMEAIKREYQLYDKVELWYDNASKYGEQFVYMVPYKKAYSILMNRKDRTRFNGLGTITGGLSANRESAIETLGNESTYTIISEGAIPASIKTSSDNELLSFLPSQQIESSIKDLKVEIVKDSLLETAITEAAHMSNMRSVAESVSIMNEAVKDNGDTIPNDTFVVDSKLEKKLKSQEGIIDPSKRYAPSDFKTPGLLLKELDRKNVILLYLESVCLGYYYLEFMDKSGNPLYTDSLFARTSSVANVGYTAGAKFQDMQTQATASDELLRYISAVIVHNLDDKFINNNPYLRKEIYAVLKHNDIYNNADLGSIRITYLAPTDVEHIKFKEDPDTHRGISDLAAGLIAAKMWACLNISNVIGILTRGQDKRVYYVKQNIEQNIAQTLLNVINQIKKNNFNIMQIENMNSILGITGKYNDYIIPVGPSGDAPIQFEVMEGQQIDPQTELMDKLEEIAVNTTEVPIELVRARLSVDFATQLTMSNSKFLRFIFKRQAKFEGFIGNIATNIYNSEHEGANIRISCVLPAPLMLNINNLSQILQLIQQQAEMLGQIRYPDQNAADNDLKQRIFIKNYVEYKLGSYIKQNEIQIITDKTEMEYQRIKQTEEV